jgi:hypothetical protein
MSPGDVGRELAATRERADGLARERDELQRQTEAQRDRNARLEQIVADAERGVLPRGGLRRVLVVVGVLLAAGAGVYVYYRKTAGEPDRLQIAAARALRSVTAPHLLVTSNVDRSWVRVDGRLVGVTPVVVTLPPVRQTYDVLVEAPHHQPFRQRVEIAREGGRTVDVTLVPAPKP